MKLTKLLNYPNVQHYLIENPSAKFKRKYPKRFIYAFREGTRVVIGNEDKIPPGLSYNKLRGFVFTYSKVSIANIFTKQPYPSNQDTTMYPTIENLDRVFRTGYDIAISLVHNKISPVGMPVDSLDIAFTIKDILTMSKEDIEEFLKESYVTFVNSSIPNTEAWVELIIELVPLTRFEMVPVFPQKITDASFKADALKEGFKMNELYLTYDVHAHSIKEEFRIAHKMDTLMIDPSFTITVEEDYGNLAGRLKRMIKRPVKSTKTSVTFTFKQYCDIKNGKFTIIDCI